MSDLQYRNLGLDLIDNGVWVENERTNTRCLTGRTKIFTYDTNDKYPIPTTRKAFHRSAVAELIGYIQGITNAQEMADLGSPTWFDNANKNKSWLDNPNRKGHNDMGFIYGAIGHNFGGIDQFEKVYNNLKNKIDDRGEIITYWKPDAFNEGCLRPCMHSFQFTLLDGTLDMTAVQRSCDVPLGLVANMQQCYVFLKLMAQITGNKSGIVTHIIHKPHIYENQYHDFLIQMQREPIDCHPEIEIPSYLQTLDDVMNLKNVDDFVLRNYESHPPIKYQFTE